MALSLLSGTSAFAETRHRDETRDSEWRRGQQGTQNRRDGSQTSRDNRSQSQWQQSQRNDNRSYDRSQSQRYDNRSNGRSQSQSYNRAPVRNESRYFQGRVNRVERYNGGYRVWVGGAGYPFFISASRWARFPLRVGLNIRLGGYWDPIGYYNVYDVGPYATAGDLHGIVESVDYRRGTVVLRDDVSGSFVTAVLRGNDPRLGDLRTGDYVTLTGAWNRSGVFDAYNVADLRGGGYGRYDDQNGRGY
ncbi:MAG TPA: hypothetical protein VII12_19760 [Thermoanaerobaculia bacterium]|jgi:hypothetical protein